jgi:phage shock protein A
VALEQEDMRLSAAVSERQQLESQISSLEQAEAELREKITELESSHRPLHEQHARLSSQLEALRFDHEQQEVDEQQRVRVVSFASGQSQHADLALWSCVVQVRVRVNVTFVNSHVFAAHVP